jgi:hypothetical protein
MSGRVQHACQVVSAGHTPTCPADGWVSDLWVTVTWQQPRGSRAVSRLMHPGTAGSQSVTFQPQALPHCCAGAALSTHRSAINTPTLHPTLTLMVCSVSRAFHTSLLPLLGVMTLTSHTGVSSRDTYSARPRWPPDHCGSG